MILGVKGDFPGYRTHTFVSGIDQAIKPEDSIKPPSICKTNHQNSPFFI